MPFEDTKILEFNQYQKSDKAPFIIYPALECIKEQTHGCKNNKNLENSFTTKVSEHILSGFSVSSISSFRIIEKEHDSHSSKDSMKKFCECLIEHAIKILQRKNGNY